MSVLDPAARAALRQSLLSAGVDGARADQSIDLAAHAADEAFKVFSAVTARGSDLGIMLCATEIGAQIAAARFRHLFDAVHDLGKVEGAETSAIVVTI